VVLNSVLMTCKSYLSVVRDVGCQVLRGALLWRRPAKVGGHVVPTAGEARRKGRLEGEMRGGRMRGMRVVVERVGLAAPSPSRGRKWSATATAIQFHTLHRSPCRMGDHRGTVARANKLKTDVLCTVGIVFRPCHRCWGVQNFILNKRRYGDLKQAPHMPSIKSDPLAVIMMSRASSVLVTSRSLIAKAYPIAVLGLG